MFLRYFKKVPFRAICSAYISHNDGLHTSVASSIDFGLIFLNVPFFDISNLFISFSISFGITSEKLNLVGSLKYSFIFNKLG